MPKITGDWLIRTTERLSARVVDLPLIGRPGGALSMRPRANTAPQSGSLNVHWLVLPRAIAPQDPYSSTPQQPRQSYAKRDGLRVDVSATEVCA